MKLHGRIIGVDESGKGDYFGPLVVAGCLAGDSDLDWLADLGVRDSKKIADGRILKLDEQLRGRLAHFVYVVAPEAYNRRYAELRNLNILLAEGHAKVITGILSQAAADLAVSDKFGKDERLETALATLKCELPLKQMTGGEAVPQVAAASILARAEFIRQMAELSQQYDITLPKGAAAQVDRAGKELVRRYGPQVLTAVAKTHFRNQQRALSVDLLH